MKVGNRIIYDQDGNIIFQSGERRGDTPQPSEIKSLNFIDLVYGEIDYTKKRIIKIDISTKKPITEDIPYIETQEEKLLREKSELENQLLIQADKNLEGGIL